MLKKTILESPTSHRNNENVPLTNDTANKNQKAQKDTTQKLFSPISQQDTTADSMVRPVPSDSANLQRKELSQILNQYQIDSTVIEKLQSKPI